MRGFDKSLDKLNVEYIDLYLVHWPIKKSRKETWKALEKLYLDKRVRAIGVANYMIPFLKELETYATIIPAVNQIEFSPYLFLKDLLNYCNERKIQLQSYSPLTRGKKFNDLVLMELANKYKKTPAQILLRWNLEHKISTIPKSSNKKRLEENFNILDFALASEDLKILDGLNQNFRVVDDPIYML